MSRKKLRLTVSLGWANDERIDEVDLPSNWNEMPEAEQEKWKDQALEEHVGEYAQSWSEIVDDEDGE